MNSPTTWRRALLLLLLFTAAFLAFLSQHATRVPQQRNTVVSSATEEGVSMGAAKSEAPLLSAAAQGISTEDTTSASPLPSTSAQQGIQTEERTSRNSSKPPSKTDAVWNTVVTNTTEPERLEDGLTRRARFLECFKRRRHPVRILMVGDSHTRSYSEAMCRWLGYKQIDCVRAALPLRFNDDVDIDLHISFISSPLFHFRFDGAYKLLKAFRKTHDHVDAIFLGRGAWDAAHNDTHPRDVLVQTHRAAGELRRAFPEAALFGMVPHYFHTPTIPHYRPCVVEPRILNVRRAFAEGVMLAHLDHLAQQDDHITTFDPPKEEDADANASSTAAVDNRKEPTIGKKQKQQVETAPVPKPDHPSKTYLVDTFCYTKPLGSYADGWGHHYKDDVLLPVLADIFAHPAISAAETAAACRDAIFANGPTNATTIFELPTPSSTHDAEWWRSGTPNATDIFAGKPKAAAEEWASGLRFSNDTAPPSVASPSGDERTFKIFSHHGPAFTSCKESAVAAWRARWNSVVASFGEVLLNKWPSTDTAGVDTPYTLDRRIGVEESVASWTKDTDTDNYIVRAYCSCDRSKFFESCPLYRPMRVEGESWPKKQNAEIRASIAMRYCKRSQRMLERRKKSSSDVVEDSRSLTLLDTTAIDSDARYWDHLLALICTATPREIGECMLNIGGDALLFAWTPSEITAMAYNGSRKVPKRLRYLSGQADGLVSASVAAMNSMRVKGYGAASWCNFTAMNHVLGLTEGGDQLDGEDAAVQKARSRFFKQLRQPSVECVALRTKCRARQTGRNGGKTPRGSRFTSFVR